MKKGQILLAALNALLLLTIGLSPLFAEAPTGSTPQPTVFIDPGHGGEDTGARGPGGTLEKDVTLQLARLVMDRLNGIYQFKSSRTNDYYIDIFKRTALANELKANLLFSFHVGGSFRHGSSGFYLYYYQLPAKPSESNLQSAEHAFDLIGDREQWRAVQLKHFSASRQLARFIRNRLGQVSDEPTFITGTEALVLAGADMPAILIETGCISNPSYEKKISDIGYLSRIADAISTGITDFMGDTSAISSMDLHQ